MINLYFSIPDITFDELNGDNNGKGDVVINNGQRIIPIKDLFTNLDLTYCAKRETKSDDEDMEVACEEELNNTIIEKPKPVDSLSNNPN